MQISCLLDYDQADMDRSRLSRFIAQPLSELPLEGPVFVSPRDSARRALALMREGSRSCVLAIEGERLQGIFTERDVLNRCMDDGFDWDKPLSDGLMTSAPRSIAAGASVGDAIATLQQQNYRTLPVMDGGRIVGLIRLGDILRHLAEAFPEDVLNLPPRPHQVMDKEEGG